jgi:hypothetical protein
VTSDAEFTSPIQPLIDAAVLPFKGDPNIDWHDSSKWPTNLWNEIKDLGSLATDVLGILTNPGTITTSFSNTGLAAPKGGSSSQSSVGLAGSLDIITLDNSATTAVKGPAQVTATTGDVTVSSTANDVSANVSGMVFNVSGIIAKNPGLQGDTSLGGSYLGANLTNSSTAYIGDNATAAATAGNVNVNASTDSLVLNVVQSGDKATKVGVTGAFALQQITDSAQAYIQSNATVNAGQNVGVNATNTVNEIAVGGSLGIGGSVSVGVTVDWNKVNETTLAYVGDPSNSRTSICAGCGVTAGGNVNVNAQSPEHLYAVSFAAAKSGSSGSGADGESSSQPAGQTAPSNSGSGGQGDNGAGGGQYGFGISGNIAINQLGDGSGGSGVTTQAFINNGAKVSATGDVNVSAQDSSLVVAVGVAGAVGQSAALAGAYSQNTFNKDVEAFTANSNLTAKGLNVTSQTSDYLINVTAGAAVNTEQGISLAGSVSNNSISNGTKAYIGDGTVAQIGSDGVTVSAAQTGLVVSVAGGVSVAPDGSGVGAAIDIGNYTNNISASEGAAQVNSAGNVQITASNNETLWPVAVSLAVGDNMGAAGAAAFEQVTNNTQASINGTLTTNSNLVLGSNDQTSLTAVAGSVGAGGDLGVSIAAVIPTVSRTTESTIGSNADVTALGASASPISYGGGNVVGTLVQATSGGSLSDYSVAGAGSGSPPPPL